MQGKVIRREAFTVGYLPQHRTIDREFPITVFDTVQSGLQCTLKWWQRYGARHRALTEETLRSLGLEALAECPIRNLSGGQWQRTLLARALVSQPRLLLLDEPDTHLDRNAKQELYASLLREHTRRAIVLVSHDEHSNCPPALRFSTSSDSLSANSRISLRRNETIGKVLLHLHQSYSAPWHSATTKSLEATALFLLIISTILR